MDLASAGEAIKLALSMTMRSDGKTSCGKAMLCPQCACERERGREEHPYDVDDRVVLCSSSSST